MAFAHASILLSVSNFQNPAIQQDLGLSFKGTAGWCPSQTGIPGEADLLLLLLEAPEARGKDFQVTSYCGSFFNLVGSHQGSGAKRRV